MSSYIDEEIVVDKVYLISLSLLTHLHSPLIWKPRIYGPLNGQHESCLSYRSQRLPINVSTTSCWPVTNSISDLDNKTEWILSNFESAGKLGVVDTLRGRASPKMDLEKPEDRASKNRYKYQQRKVSCSALGWDNPKHQYTDCLGEAWWKGQVDTRLNMSQQGAFPANKANHILGNSKRSVSSRSNYSPPLHTQNTVPVWMPPMLKFKRNEQKLEMIQLRATEMVQGIQNITYKKLRELGLFYLMKRRPWGSYYATVWKVTKITKTMQPNSYQ